MADADEGRPLLSLDEYVQGIHNNGGTNEFPTMIDFETTAQFYLNPPVNQELFARRVGEALLQTVATSIVDTIDARMIDLMVWSDVIPNAPYPMLKYLRTTPNLKQFRFICDVDQPTLFRRHDGIANTLVASALVANKSITKLLISCGEDEEEESSAHSLHLMHAILEQYSNQAMSDGNGIHPLRDIHLTMTADSNDLIGAIPETEQGNGDLTVPPTGFVRFFQYLSRTDQRLENLTFSHTEMDDRMFELLFVTYPGRFDSIRFEHCILSADFCRRLGALMRPPPPSPTNANGANAANATAPT